MPKPILVANWKNYPSSLVEAKSLLKGLSKHHRIYKKFSFFIAPPLPYLELVSSSSRNFAKLASQNISSQFDGTYTGEVTPDILKSFGVRLTIIGHSERRALGEANEIVSHKIKNAFRSGTTPLVCVGELSRDQDGDYFEYLRQQIKLSLAGLKKKDASKIVLAYEPVWAIGREAKSAIEPPDLSETILFIKKVLTDIFDRAHADKIPILYGGSVDTNNAAELSKSTGIRGFLIGRASLDAKKFEAIARSLIEK